MTDKKIDVDDYLNRAEMIGRQYVLAIHALDLMKNSTGAKESAAIDIVEGNLKFDTFVINEALQKPSERAKDWIKKLSDVSSAYTEATKSHVVFTIGILKNTIRQNTLISFIAHFECFIKDVHRAILQQNTKLILPGQDVPLHDLIHKGREQILQEYIERRVQKIDYLSTDAQCKYFDKHYDIKWFGTFRSYEKEYEIWEELLRRQQTLVKSPLDLLARLVSYRNKILHEKPNLVIRPLWVFLAGELTSFIAQSIFDSAREKYPDGFAQ